MAEWCFQFSFQKHPRAGGQRCPAAVFIVFPSGVQRVGAEWRIGLGSLLWGPIGGSLSEVVEHVEACWTYLLQNTSAKHVVDRSTAARSGKESRFFWDKGGMDMDPWGLWFFGVPTFLWPKMAAKIEITWNNTTIRCSCLVCSPVGGFRLSAIWQARRAPSP